eukprot:CAMPEP_0119479772 /NCGR_PEP_ID=MMETSP1344-20130328/8887_1 /TAXON_ID=236787 /ORGANISM="Florenciella parvula, Strain CCMP2471" /LENGTH=952 /DNA_ID=CAMNT_0007514031 /DNA_START=117 /DNA_END=2972 /DNA_ORIENTATION=+
MTKEELSVAKAQSASAFGRSVVDGSSFTMEYTTWGGMKAAVLNFRLGCVPQVDKLTGKCHDSQAQLMNETKIPTSATSRPLSTGTALPSVMMGVRCGGGSTRSAVWGRCMRSCMLVFLMVLPLIVGGHAHATDATQRNEIRNGTDSAVLGTKGDGVAAPPSPRRLTEECPSTCHDYDCDYWVEANSEYTCAVMESTYNCDCSGCSMCNDDESGDAHKCLFTLNMVDSYGDGWDGAKWTWTEDSTNSDADTGTLDNGASGTAPLCGVGCYTLSVGVGDYPSEVSWTIVKDDTGREEASGGAGESATVCSTAQPSPLPTTSPPTTTASPTREGVNTFSELKKAITTGSNAQINVVDNIVFDEAITISAAVNLTIRSSVGAVLIGGDIGAVDGGLFHIKDASDVTFTGLGFKNGSASNYGGCLFVTGSSNIEVEDADFVECIAGEYGGGMALYDSSSAIVSGTSYTNCSASGGGGMFLYDSSSATVSDTSYTNCSADYRGGGMALFSSSSATVSDTSYTSCSAGEYGGGMALYDSSATVSGTSYTSCSAGKRGGGMYLYDSSATVSGTSYTSCSADWGGGMYLSESSSATVSGTSYTSCSANEGGGVVLESSSVTVSDTSYTSCSADNSGGGMALYDSSSAIVSGTSYTSCSAGSFGGGMALVSSSSATVSDTSYTNCSAGEFGGGMYLYLSTATLIDLAAQDNHDSLGGPDIHNDGGSFTCATSCTVGQYGDCQDEAYTSDALYKCYVNCGGCHDCPAGTSNDEVGSTTNSSCQACPTGFASTSSGATSCTSCEAGRFATDDGPDYIVVTKATDCSACPAGSHQPTATSVYCAPCDAGKSSNGTAGAAACTTCPAGTASSTGSATCTPCAPGYHQPAQGSDTCIPCAAGYFTGAGATECQPCSAGTVSATGAAACTLCDAGKSSAAASDACAMCPAGRASSAGASACDDCETGA